MQKHHKGDVGGNGEETLPVTQWSVFGIWCEEEEGEVSNCQIQVFDVNKQVGSV